MYYKNFATVSFNDLKASNFERYVGLPIQHQSNEEIATISSLKDGEYWYKFGNEERKITDDWTLIIPLGYVPIWVVYEGDRVGLYNLWDAYISYTKDRTILPNITEKNKPTLLGVSNHKNFEEVKCVFGRICKITGKLFTCEPLVVDLLAYVTGGMSINEFHYLNAKDREFLMSFTTDAEFNEMFSEEE